tara:strand:+ start:20731 stop:20928 length:198 start_codon:yes stop_codon:yes gene_type:complete
MTHSKVKNKSWYRHFWPWFIITFLVVTISACMLTMYLAIKYPDLVVKDNWVKDGMTVYQQDAVKE